jgi:hypothetical protein
MIVVASIFLDLAPLTPATGFYAALFLAVALFVKFSRLLSIRNWDVVTLFLPVPGLLLLIEPGGADRWAYLALLGASFYFFLRCLFDLTLEKRPALAPNLTLGGLLCIACGLFVSLTVPLRPSPLPEDKKAAPTDKVRENVEAVAVNLAPQSEVEAWGERGLALACHFAVALALIVIGRIHFEDVSTGAAAATLYLLLPCTHLLMPTGALSAGRWHHAWPMVWLTWAVVAYRRPMIAGAGLGVAAGTSFFPVLVLPIWLSFYYRRGTVRFLTGFLLSGTIALLILSVPVMLNGELPPSLRSAWTDSNWQPWQQPSPETAGVWQGIHWAYRIPVFLAFAAFVLTTLFWPWPKNLAHVLALTTAVLIGIQFWYADQGGIYVLWYLPFLLLLVFRPNLSASRPPLPPPDDWPVRLGRLFQRLLARWLPRPEPAAAPSRKE